MALPSFLGNFVVGASRVHGKFITKFPAFYHCSEISGHYNVIGPLWPTYFMPSMAFFAISHGGLYYVYRNDSSNQLQR
jgi:hypothetical protein